MIGGCKMCVLKEKEKKEKGERRSKRREVRKREAGIREGDGITGRCQSSKYILVGRNFTLGNNTISEDGT